MVIINSLFWVKFVVVMGGVTIGQFVITKIINELIFPFHFLSCHSYFGDIQLLVINLDIFCLDYLLISRHLYLLIGIRNFVLFALLQLSLNHS